MTAHAGNDAEKQRIYTLASQWFMETLPEGGSILTPGKRIWTLENLEELDEKFVQRPDLRAGLTFLQKLQEQLSDASPDAVQLMAELHVVFFWWIWEGAISGKKKISDINAILSWHPDRPALPAEVAASMSPGFAHPGQWANTRRDVQLATLITLTSALLRESPEKIAGLQSDPLALRDFWAASPTPSGDAARWGLLHELYPDVFESTVSPTHKRLIIDRFAQEGDDTSDADRALMAIRRRLSGAWGEGYSYYDASSDPLHWLWAAPLKQWNAFLSWARRLWETTELDFDRHERSYKVEVAGRLSEARRAASDSPDWPDLVRAGLNHKSNNLTSTFNRLPLNDWVRENPADGAHALHTLWDDARPENVAHAVDAFARLIAPSGRTTPGAVLSLASTLLLAKDEKQFPPVTIQTARTMWRLAGWGEAPPDSTPGHLLHRAYLLFDEVLRDATTWENPPRDRLDVQGLLWTLVRLGEKPDTWSEAEWDDLLAFRGAVPFEEGEEPLEPEEIPTTEVDYLGDAATQLSLDRSFLEEIAALLDDKGQVVFYGPPGTGKTFVAKRLATALAEGEADRTTIVQFHPASTYEDFFEGLRPTLAGGQVHYELRPGPLARIAEAASADPDHTYVLVIDELNRANVPKVMGELLFLLEYRDAKVATLYRPEGFELPRNLLFIATMNTADRSVALVDAALRRRFHFIPFFPHLGTMKGLLRRWLHRYGRATAVADLLDAVNAELRTEVGDHLVIGPSHFMKEDLSEEALERIWTYNIHPTLEELLWGRTEELARWSWPAVRARYQSQLNLGAAPQDGEPAGESPHANTESGVSVADGERP